MPSKKNQDASARNSASGNAPASDSASKPKGMVLKRQSYAKLSFNSQVALIEKNIRGAHIKRLGYRQEIEHTGRVGIAYARREVVFALLDIIEKAHNIADCGKRKKITGDDYRHAAKLSGIPRLVSN